MGTLTVFRDTESACVYKIFIGPSHPNGYSCEDEERRRKVFRSECEAYEILSQDELLRSHAPKFFGTVTIDDVLDENGQSEADRYLLDCCYKMEFIEGNACKIGALESVFPHLRQAVRHFQDAGVAYMKDCCVFFPEDKQQFKFIDFATKEFEPPAHNLPLVM